MDYLVRIIGPLLEGTGVTLQVFLISFVLSVPLGLALALVRVSRFAFASSLVNGYIWLMRGTPLMLQMLFIYFALPFVPLIGVRLPDFPAAIVAFVLNYAAYFAEIFRAGIQSIERGQMEAARALGMNYFQAMRHVILPQAIRRVLPALGNDFIAMLKDSSLVSVLGVSDITQLAKLYASSTFLFFQTYSLLALIYLTLTITLSRGVQYLERRLSQDRR